MGDFFLTSMSDVSCPIPLHPDWTFQGGEVRVQSFHRSQSGRFFGYHWGTFRKYALPLRYVNSSDQSRITQWWSAGHDTVFTLDSSATEATALCRIVNEVEPLPQFTEPYRDLYQGEIQLETLADEPLTRRPFILDDALFGLLDQDFNALLG